MSWWWLLTVPFGARGLYWWARVGLWWFDVLPLVGPRRPPKIEDARAVIALVQAGDSSISSRELRRAEDRVIASNITRRSDGESWGPAAAEAALTRTEAALGRAEETIRTISRERDEALRRLSKATGSGSSRWWDQDGHEHALPQREAG